MNGPDLQIGEQRGAKVGARHVAVEREEGANPCALLCRLSCLPGVARRRVCRSCDTGATRVVAQRRRKGGRTAE
jgi:hypothetical protein